MSLSNLLGFVRHALWPAGTERMSAPIEFGSDRATAPINLLRGWPNPSLLPVDLLKEAADAVLSDTSIAHPGLLYGPDEGYAPFREAVAAWLNAFYKPERPIESSRICINGGASQSLGSLLNVYTDPEYTRNVWFVAPAYMLAFRVFEDAGFAGKMRAVPEDEEGIDIAYLARELAKSEEKAKSRGNTQPLYKPDRQRAKVYKHVVYCVPTFSNPSSRTMSLQRRRELVRLARDFDALVTCDDVYDFLQWPTATDQVGGSGIKIRPMKTAHLPRLVDVDRSLDGGAGRQGADGFGNVCSNGTFSKLAGPGLRCGWVEGTEKFSYGASQAGTQRSGGAPCQLTSTYITKVVASGELQRHIETVLQPAYASRYKTMAKAIEDHLLPLGFSMPQPNRDVIGGYFIWLGLPADLKGHELVQKCQDGENLIVSPGSAFEVPGDESISFASNVRLCFAWEDEWKLREGVKRIGKVAKRLLERGDDGSEDYVVVENGDEDRLQASK